MVGMCVVPAIITAYWLAVSSDRMEIKSIPVAAAASVLAIGIFAFFEFFSFFKLKNPIIFILNRDGSGFYLPTFKKFEFRLRNGFNIEKGPDGVYVSPTIDGLPFFASRDGRTFIQTNSSYDVSESVEGP